MGVIVLDASRVNSYILPSLNKSENLIQTAYNTSVSLRNSLPSSFKQRSAVNEIVNEIYNIKKEINNIEGIIDSKLAISKRIESKSESRVSSIASAASKIGGTIGLVGGSVLGDMRSGVLVPTVDGVVGNKSGETILGTGARIVNNCKSVYSQIENGVSNVFDKIGAFTSKLCTAIGNGVETAGDWVTDADTWKKIGTTIADGVTAAWNWGTDPNTWKKIGTSICNGFKTAGDWVTDPENWKKLGTTIADGVTTAWNWAKDIENWKKLGASIVNGAIALIKGLLSLVEAIGDFAMLLDTTLKTGYTAIQDVATAILTDGNLDWNATKKLWDGTKSKVAYNWTNKIFDSLYDTKFGQTLDEYAYSPFKSDGMGCEIIEGVGYVAGVIVLTICTFGAGGVATAAGATMSTTTAMAMTATAAGVGKYTSEEWNKNSISVNYGGTDVDFAIDYEKYSEIEKLKQGESTTISQQITLEDGSIQELILNITSKGNGEYIITDKDGNLASLNSLNESSTVKGLAIGGLKGAWEGAQWYVGGKIGTGEFTKITGKITSPVLKKITTSGTRVVLDTATGVVEVPFQSLVAMMSEGKTWDEAWKSQGGWQAVGTQAGIAGLSSLGGEVFDLTKVLKTGAEIDENAISKKVVELDDNAMLTNYINSRSNIELELSKVNNQIETNKKEWFELYQKTKTPEYKSAIENIENGYAGSLTDMDSAIAINKRMKELQSDMDILIKSKEELEISLTNVSDNINSLDGVKLLNFIDNADDSTKLLVSKNLDIDRIKQYAPALIKDVNSKNLVPILDNIFRNYDVESSLKILGTLSLDQVDNVLKNCDKFSDNAMSRFIKKTAQLYKNGIEVAMPNKKYNWFYSNFREHGMKHALAVAEYANKLGKNLDYIDLEETLTAALAHDFGMRGGVIVFDDVMMKKINKELSELNLNASEILELENLKGKVMTLDDAHDILTKKLSNGNPLFSEKDFTMNFARSNHPLNSALDIIKFNESLPPGVDKEVASLLAMTHSKSTSGISYFNSKIQWENCIDKLKQAADFEGIDFDADKLRGMIKNKETFDRLQMEAAIIRDGDAMSPVVEKDGKTLMQEDSYTQVEILKRRDTFDDPTVMGEKAGKPKDIGADLEANNLKDTAYYSNGSTREVDDAFSKRIHAGELNTKYDSIMYIDENGKKIYKASVEIKDATEVPYSTYKNSIEERLGEIKTYTNFDERSFEIILPKEAEGTALAEWYQKQLNKTIDGYMEDLAEDLTKTVTKIVDGMEVTERIIDDSIKTSQEEFFEQLKKSIVYR